MLEAPKGKIQSRQEVSKCTEIISQSSFVLLRQADEYAVEKNLAHISSNTQTLNKPKRLAFKWRWQAVANCV